MAAPPPMAFMVFQVAMATVISIFFSRLLIFYVGEQIAIVSGFTDLQIIPPDPSDGFLQVSGGYRYHYFEANSCGFGSYTFCCGN